MSQSSFPPPQYGPPQYGPLGVPPKRSRAPLILVIVLGVVLVVVLAVGAVVLFRADTSSEGKGSTRAATPEAVQFRPVLAAEQGGCTATPSPSADSTACGPDGVRYTLGKVELDGTHVSEVKPAGSEGSGGWIVGLTLDDEGSQKFSRLTSELTSKPAPQNQLAIVVRGRVITAPTVMSAITGGKVEISSDFTQQEAEQLAEEITG
jgi:preprotein translocase subunit SecD